MLNHSLCELATLPRAKRPIIPVASGSAHTHTHTEGPVCDADLSLSLMCHILYRGKVTLLPTEVANRFLFFLIPTTSSLHPLVHLGVLSQ